MSSQEGALVTSLGCGLIVIFAGLILEVVGVSNVSIYLVIAGAALFVGGAIGLLWRSRVSRHNGGAR